MSLKTSKVIGMEDLQATLRDVAPNEAVNLSRSTTQALAMELRGMMRAKVAKDTGETEKSITARRSRTRGNIVASRVRVGKAEAFHLEYGTHDTPAQAFFMPSIEAMRGKLAQRWRELFGVKYEQLMVRKVKKSLG